MQDWVKPLVLEGQAVRLEPLEPRHAPDLLAAATPDLFRFTPQAPAEWSIDGFKREIEKVRAIANSIPFAVIHRQRDRAVGRTTYMEIRPSTRGLEIGRTWIGREFQGTTVNPEMKYLMLRHAFETLGAVRVQLTTAQDNLHSQRAIAKLGAVREGVLRNYGVRPDGSPRDTVIFSIIAPEWPATKTRLEERLRAGATGQPLGAGPC